MMLKSSKQKITSTTRELLDTRRRGKPKQHLLVRPSEDIVSAVRLGIESDGARAIAARLGISTHTAIKLAAGFPCRESTVICAAHRLGLPISEVVS